MKFQHGDSAQLYPWQAEQWTQLQRAHTESRLPHGLLLQGSKGLGKHDFANCLSAALFCQSAAESRQQGQPCGHCNACKLLEAGTHPDFYPLRPTASKTSTSKKPLTSIRIDDIRELCAQLAQTSQFGGYRIAIIDEADKLTHEAANSLLKTLEEPGGGVLIMLITAHPARLPATIRSRTQQLRFAVPATDISVAWLEQAVGTSYSSEQILQALKHANGSPLAAIEQLETVELNQLIEQAMLARDASAPGAPSIIEYAAKLITYDRRRVLDAMLGWVSDAIRISLDAGVSTDGSDTGGRLINIAHAQALKHMIAGVSISRLYWFYDEIQKQRRLESIALNEQLLWENLLLSWKQL
jgi:DNA polymerase-3 subunit delta'